MSTENNQNDFPQYALVVILVLLVVSCFFLYHRVHMLELVAEEVKVMEQEARKTTNITIKKLQMTHGDFSFSCPDLQEYEELGPDGKIIITIPKEENNYE